VPSPTAGILEPVYNLLRAIAAGSTGSNPISTTMLMSSPRLRIVIHTLQPHDIRASEWLQERSARQEISAQTTLYAVYLNARAEDSTAA
jgi:hypothetical protein